MRVLETGIEDGLYALAINRIRHYYLELADEDARYFLFVGNDDREGVAVNMGMSPSRWRPFFSIASMVGLINSMVAGALVGIGLDALVPRPVSLVAGAAVTAAAFVIHYRLGHGRFLREVERRPALFPSEPGP